MFKVSLTLADAQTLEQNQDKLLDLPARGVPVNGGKHAPIAQTWDNVGAPPAGWRSYRNSTMQHPTLPQWATRIDQDSSAAMANGRRSRLSAGEQVKMAADMVAAIVSLPVDWAGAVVPVGTKGEEAGGRT